MSTFVLFLYLWLIGKLHQDYVNYSELNSDHEYLALSFVIKWCAFFLGIMVYLLLNSLFPRSKKLVPTVAKKNQKTESDQDAVVDPFAEIRQRKKLRSRADFIIEKHKK